MIELFDARRLRPRVDHSLALATACLVLVAAGLGAYGWTLQQRLLGLERERSQLQQALQAPADAAAPSRDLLADLERQAANLEAESGVAAGDDNRAGTAPAAWMLRLAGLAAPDISLTRIEIDRGGAVRIEGQATTAQAVSRFVQAWDREQGADAALPTRAVELRHDADAAAAGLRFKLRATAAARANP